MIDFPDSPTPGQEFTVGDVTWVFNDPVWDIKIPALLSTPYMQIARVIMSDVADLSTAQMSVASDQSNGEFTFDPAKRSSGGPPGAIVVSRPGIYVVALDVHINSNSGQTKPPGDSLQTKVQVSTASPVVWLPMLESFPTINLDVSGSWTVFVGTPGPIWIYELKTWAQAYGATPGAGSLAKATFKLSVARLPGGAS